MNKILVLRGGALGDFIVTLPALALLRTRWPAARIELVGNATAGRLARPRGLLDAVHSQHEARWSALYGAGPLPPELAAWLSEFDLVVSYWPDPDGELRRRFPQRHGQVVLFGEPMPTRAPAAAHYCQPLETLGLRPTDYRVRLDVAAPRGSAGTVPPPTPSAGIAIHPGSGSPRKNWPLENWLELIPRLPGPVTLILGEAELERWSSLSSSRLGNQSPQLLITPSLEDLVGQLSASRLFLGHDSGVSHLAAACGTPCVLLFGPTDAAIWAPPGPGVRVLQRGADLRAISTEEAWRAAMAALADRT